MATNPQRAIKYRADSKETREDHEKDENTTPTSRATPAESERLGYAAASTAGRNWQWPRYIDSCVLSEKT